MQFGLSVAHRVDPVFYGDGDRDTQRALELLLWIGSSIIWYAWLTIPNPGALC